MSNIARRVIVTRKNETDVISIKINVVSGRFSRLKNGPNNARIIPRTDEIVGLAFGVSKPP